MAINEIITENQISTTTNPTALVSDIVVEGNGRGQIFLQCRVAGGEWVNVASETGAFSLNTPDNTLEYRFKALDLKQDVRVFFGP